MNVFAGKHTLTFGGSLEKFSFDNSFNLTGYGARVFFPDVPMADIATVLKSKDFAAEVTAAKDAFNKNSWALAETNLGQFAIYAQDEFAVNNKLNLS